MHKLGYDKQINKTVCGEKLRYGILYGNEKIVFIKVGAGGSIRGYQDKYLQMAQRVHERMCATVICASNPDAEIKNNYLEYLVVDGVPELLGNLNTGEVNLDDYTSKKDFQKLETKFNNVVGDITKLTTYNADNPQTIIQELNAINERLKWEDIPG